MKTWAGANVAAKKITTALKKITPPEPDDQFEDLRRDALKFVDKWSEYLSIKVTEIAGQEEEADE